MTSQVDTRIVGFSAAMQASLQRSPAPSDPGNWQSGGNLADGSYDDVLLSYIPAGVGEKDNFFQPGFPLLAGREVFVAFAGSGFFQLTLDDSAVI